MNKVRLWQSLILCILVLFSAFLPVSAENGGEQTSEDMPKELYARSAVLMDADSGRVLFGKEENVVRPMASTTKIMTCILALENMKEGQIVTASKNAASQPKVRLGMQEGETFYLKDLLYSLMLESHNDSAVAIAEGIAGSVKVFADLMNQKAKKIGCEHTYFVTPNGLDAENEGGTHSTTAADLARIMRYCIMESSCKEEFLAVTSTRNYQFQNLEESRLFSCSNHNAFLDMMDGALTGKTGFTGNAGYCYVGALKRDDRTFIVALLACGWPGNKSYKWSDTRKLMEYGIECYQYQDVWVKTELPNLSVSGGVSTEDPYEEEVQVSLKYQEEVDTFKVLLGKTEKVTVKEEIAKTLNAPVKKGRVVGNVKYFLGDQELASFPVVTKEEVRERTFCWCLAFAAQRFCF
ncbi:MAG: D-alanyl-D-alanine carboxypeptidase [Dorea sp.]|nr:D-alanyl-D-alanine carboxypeptidase [Dorea sp.]MDY2812644.1 D-alanyl-D-alanine carboxypeptidase family protein [Dorea sp.]